MLTTDMVVMDMPLDMPTMDTDMPPGMDMVVMDMPLDMPTMDTDMPPGMDMDMDTVMDTDMPTMDTTARGLLMLSQLLMLIMDTVLMDMDTMVRHGYAHHGYYGKRSADAEPAADAYYG